jgi:hypothetical protein
MWHHAMVIVTSSASRAVISQMNVSLWYNGELFWSSDVMSWKVIILRTPWPHHMTSLLWAHCELYHVHGDIMKPSNDDLNLWGLCVVTVTLHIWDHSLWGQNELTVWLHIMSSMWIHCHWKQWSHCELRVPEVLVNSQQHHAMRSSGITHSKLNIWDHRKLTIWWVPCDHMRVCRWRCTHWNISIQHCQLILMLHPAIQVDTDAPSSNANW